MPTDLDLDAYFERIAWNGPTRPDMESLRGILAAHMARIPFENLDVLLGRPIRLDLQSLQEKLVGARRGGYCFEHMTLFAAVLEALGFRFARHSARVIMVVPRTESPRTHMILTVELAEGRFVLDAGFGVLAPRVPVPVVDELEVRAEDEVHRLVRDGPWWVLQARVDEAMKDAWASTLEEDNPIDFEVGNHYTSTHPSSNFRNRIMLRALIADGRVTVSNQDVTIRSGGEVRTRKLEDRRELRELLVEYFGFDLPEVERMRVPSVPAWK
jgi:N-hydroxyarylamine O-acetyltransferase